MVTKLKAEKELKEREQLFGDPVKQSAQASAKVPEARKWLRFLLMHAEEYSFNACAGPSVELVKHKYKSRSPPRVAYHTAPGDERGHTGGITTARNESLPPVHNRPMNSPLEGKSASCNPARL